MKKLKRRSLLLGSGAAIGALGAVKLYSDTLPFGASFPENTAVENALVLNDASELSPVQVAQHLVVREKPDAALLETLRNSIKDAQANRQPIVASTARHSMGGQSLASGGLAITQDQEWIEPDVKAATYRVAAGTRWRVVIRELDKLGFSPKVMQSNNDFGVASTFSVNAHGWPVTFSGGGTTARSIKVLLASGEHVLCSRTENPDLFRAALGGYGLLGVITELEMEMVPNTSLKPTFTAMPAEDFGLAFEKTLRANKNIQMAYGRLNVDIAGFFEQGLMITYEPDGDQSALPAAAGSGFISKVSRDIFRQQVGSDRWKNLRWGIEARLNPWINGGNATRNSLMNEPVVTLDDRDPLRADILHEYFVAPSRFAEFVQACRKVIPSSFQEMLNITLRFVDTDTESMLAYATVPRVAAVMLFSQEKSQRAEADMARMTHALIERVLAMDGTYYLPYRPHATLAQFQRGYQRHAEFLATKREYDPGLAFRNGLWDNYIGKL